MREMFSEVDPAKPEFRHVFAYMGAIRTQDQPEVFRAIDHLKAYTGMWGSFSTLFQWCFLKDGGIIEQPAEGVLVHSYTVKDRALWNQHTLDLLGGESEVVISLFGLLSIISQVEAHPDVYKNSFKTNGWSNYFYLKDHVDILRCVHVKKEQERYHFSVPQKIFSETSCVKPSPGDRMFSRLERAWS